MDIDDLGNSKQNVYINQHTIVIADAFITLKYCCIPSLGITVSPKTAAIDL